MKKLVIVDGDVLVYRGAFACERRGYRDSLGREFATKKDWDGEFDIEPFREVINHDYPIIVRGIMKELHSVFQGHDILVGMGNKNTPLIRKQLYDKYKENRKDAAQPLLKNEISEYILQNYDCTFPEKGHEVDDLLGIVGEGNIIVSIDKDLLGVPATHYNIATKQINEVLPGPGDLWLDKRRQLKGNGLAWCLIQAVKGDRVDNIPNMKGFGDVSIYKRLGDLPCRLTQEPLEDILQELDELFVSDTTFNMNLFLTWILRKNTPPEIHNRIKEYYETSLS